MNGLFSENALVRDSDDIFVPFEYELLHDLPKNPIQKNLIIDSRCEKILLNEIFKNGIETLIYNTTRHKVINIYQYFEDIMGISKIVLSINRIRKICFIFLVVKYVFKKLNTKPDVRYILERLSNDEFLKLDIIGNSLCLNPEVAKLESEPITSEKFTEMKNKMMRFETISEKKQVLKSFIIMISSEIISI